MKQYLTRWTLSLTAITAFLLIGPASLAAQETQTFKADLAHSDVMFRANHLDIGYTFGEFLKYDATLKYDKKDVSNSSLNVTIQADSVETHQDKRDKHLKGPDFLNAKKNGDITFESKKVKRIDDETLEVSGDLTIRGTTKPITIEVKELGSGKDPEGHFRRGFYTEFDINRLDYGVDWNPKVVGKNLRIILAFEFVKKK
ncbi:MAG: YceI family protein [Bradymonadaceae bacterium]